MLTARAYIVRPAVIAPTLLSVVAIVLAVLVSWWSLAAVPFVWLGSICAQPNMNFADGCLTWLAIIAGFSTLFLFQPLGVSILSGVSSSYIFSVLEKTLLMRPIPDDEHD